MRGRDRHRLAALTPAFTTDGGGGRSASWTEGEAFWAQVERLSSVPDFFAGGRARLRRIAVTTRAREDLSLGGRLNFYGAPYEVVSLEDADERGERRTYICEEAQG